MLGHEEENCRKKNKVRKEWRVVQTDGAAGRILARQDQQQETHNLQEGFIRPRRPIPRAANQQHTTIQSPLSNVFQALLEEEVEIREARAEDSRPSPMDNIITWNIRGLNSPNKQEDITGFLNKQNVAFKEIIHRHCQTQMQGSQMMQVYEIFKNVRGPLRKLNRDKFADAHEQQGIASRKLELIQEQLQHNPRDRDLMAQEKECRANYMRTAE
ncbi:hypothetical protein Cgig2_032392 [Carnegiea gigantea]|uniref:Uncharacterized protein n=1 Tax=Carnegiea gigantea TaxID=171969 RepID=A0A9Q1JLT2_9CARY|nr:hypothetical protein Cgig2_032392 [Carnegiea gigantea]